MKSGLQLVKAHIESFFEGRTQDFQHQVTPDYRHYYLPDNLGEGPEHVKRWRDILFSIYREWSVEICDEHDEGEEVIIRLNFVGRKPAESHMSPTVESSAVLHYAIVDGRLASCSSLHPAFEDFDNAVLIRSAHALQELH